MPDFKLPDLGEGVTEAEIDRWLVTEGDRIAEDDPLVDVITDKASAEIPSPFEGVVTRIHVQPGDVVPVGTVLVTIDGEDATSTRVPVSEQPQATPSTAPSTDADTTVEIKAMPPVRKLARELGVDLTQVPASGPGGRIVREDVEAFAARHTAVSSSVVAQPETAPAAPAAAIPSGARVPLRGVRRTIAERMSHAHLAIPPVTHVEECDVTELDATRRAANERAGAGETKLTFLPFIVKAVVAGLRAYPALNATLDEEAGEIVYHDRYDVGVAVDTPAGLAVPVVRAADQKSLRALAREIERLAEAARGGALKAEELRGGTFTVTSPGPFGGLMATPIIFHPQAAILGVHRATQRPVVRDGQIVARLMMNLSITFDHRILDGVTAAKFCMEVARLLEHPALLTLDS